MTEEEAITKFCPIIMPNPSLNTVGFFGTKCLGIKCMIWRVTIYSKYDGEGSGYCGLAGKE